MSKTFTWTSGNKTYVLSRRETGMRRAQLPQWFHQRVLRHTVYPGPTNLGRPDCSCKKYWWT